MFIMVHSLFRCAGMIGWCSLSLSAIVALSPCITRAQISATPAEIRTKSDWVQENLLNPGKAPPFSFAYGARSRSALLRSLPRDVKVRKIDANRNEQVITWTHASTGLEVRCVVVDYRDYPAVEWTVYLKNRGKQDTPIINGLQGLDVRLRRGNQSEFVLAGIKGDWCVAESFQPYEVELGPAVSKSFSPSSYSGKSSEGPDGWPYFNLQMPGGGIIMAVGWPGQWASSFMRVGPTGLKVKAGQQLTHFSLKPGEEVRAPLVAMLFWRGKDIVRAQNLWRRWYRAHNMPHFDGQPQSPLTHIAAVEISVANSYLNAGIQPNVCWRDAGWYPRSTGPYTGGESWLNTGTWEIDPTTYADGFRPFSDWIHDRGMKFLLWFEPERVGDPNSWLGKNHPEWLLPATESTVGAILNLGNPGALVWLVGHIDGMIKSQGIDWYREDMNGGPLPTLRNNDAEDRQGITENFYVQGHLAFWDELKRRNPGLCIDSCASGGRRNDLETMRRAVPLLRSDFQFPDRQQGVFEGNQCHTHGLSSWLPFQGTGVYRYDPYSFRSFYLPSFGMGGLSPENTEAQQQAYSECAKIAPSMLFGDYYPLTPYSLADDAWIAWQFNRPETGEGCVQACRRPGSPTAEMTLKLHGLDPKQTYQVVNFDQQGAATLSGEELMTSGLIVEIEPRGSVVFHYQADVSIAGASR